MTEIPVLTTADFQLPDLHHIRMVVRDRDVTIGQYRDVVGISSFISFDAQFAYALVHGKPKDVGLRVGFAWLGNTLLKCSNHLITHLLNFNF